MLRKLRFSGFLSFCVVFALMIAQFQPLNAIPSFGFSNDYAQPINSNSTPKRGETFGTIYPGAHEKQSGNQGIVSEITDWIVESSVEADDIEPVMDLYYYPLEQWEHVMENPDHFFDVSVITRNGKQGLIDSAGNIRLAVDRDYVYFFMVFGRICADINRLIDYDYRIAHEGGGIGGFPCYSTFAWNYYDNRLYVVYRNVDDYYIQGPLSVAFPIPIKEEFRYDLLSMPKGNVRALSDIRRDFLHNPEGKGAEFDSDAVEFVFNHEFSDILVERDKYAYATGDRLISDFIFDQAYSFVEERAAVVKGGVLNYILTDGSMISSKGYDLHGRESEYVLLAQEIYPFSEGLAAVSKNGKWGYINKYGQEVVPFKYEATRPIYKGKAWVKVNGKWGVADLSEHIKYGNMDTNGRSGDYIYDTADPGDAVELPVSELEGVSDTATATAAVKSAADSLSEEQKKSSVGVDLLTLYSEAAVAQSASKQVDGNTVELSKTSIESLKAASEKTKKSVEKTIRDAGIETQRELGTDVQFEAKGSGSSDNSSSSGNDKLIIRIDPSSADSGVDHVRVESQSCSVTLPTKDFEKHVGDSALVITITEKSGEGARTLPLQREKTSW